MRGLVLCVCLALAACSPHAVPKKGPIQQFDGIYEYGPLTIVNDNGDNIEFGVYFATDFDLRRRGLMFVRDMPERVGMLFIYEEDDYHSMWMKNTYIPLDMLFVRSDGSVSSINADTVPLTLTSQGPVEPIRYVLELNAGTARRLQIGKHSRLLLDGL